MSALPETVIKLPKRKPRTLQKEAPPDLRKVSVLPIKAVFDQKLTHGALQVLAAICAFANRAGITWVSQKRLAKDLGISQQAVAKQFKQLRENGYLITVRKGFRGERTDTIRVVFDSTVDTDTAIAVTSAIEDTRPPIMKKEQAMQEEVDREGQRVIAQAIAQAFNKPRKEVKAMPKDSDSRTVKAIKEANQKGAQRRTRSAPNHNQEVVNEEGSHTQPKNNLGVVPNAENTGIRLTLEDVKRLKDEGLTAVQIQGCLEDLLCAYAAEGITPKPEHLQTGVLELHRMFTKMPRHQEGL
jgi:DNA-binding transcriptional regulator YhcF (GntR family)